jgi:hypothetical protein
MRQRAGCSTPVSAPLPQAGVVPASSAMALRRSRMLAWFGLAGACACALAVMLALAPRIGTAAGIAVAFAVGIVLAVLSQWQERGRPIAIELGLEGALITWHRRGTPMRHHRIVGHARVGVRLLALRLAPYGDRPARFGAGPRSVLVAADAIAPAHFRELAIALTRQRRQPRAKRRAPAHR